MRKGFLIDEEMRKYLTISEEVVSHIWLCNSLLNILIYEENLIFFSIMITCQISRPYFVDIFVFYAFFCNGLEIINEFSAFLLPLLNFAKEYFFSSYWQFLLTFKGTVSRDFLLLVFFMNQFPSSPWVYHKGRFKFFRKFADIFAAQGWPPVSTTPVANIQSPLV
jgi:hypothetical protein